MKETARSLVLGFMFIVAGMLLISPAGVAGQTTANVNGTWIWKSKPNKKNESTLFSLEIKQKANRVSGQIWFGMLSGDENDGSDSSSIPFVGVVRGSRLTIEFDPDDIHSIEDENVRYKRPRSPATATLDLRAGKLHWNEGRGVLDKLGLGPLRSFILSKPPA